VPAPQPLDAILKIKREQLEETSNGGKLNECKS
jgi:hypothetical protein